MRPTWGCTGKFRLVLKVLIKEGLVGIDFLSKEKATNLMAFLGTSILHPTATWHTAGAGQIPVRLL